MNGESVTINQVKAEADISEFIQEGENEITAIVNSNLNNQIVTLGLADRDIQEYGLYGPVVVSPYLEVAVD